MQGRAVVFRGESSVAGDETLAAGSLERLAFLGGILA
jgi:hypothetical protein